MTKHITIMLLLTYSFSVMYFYVWTQRAKPLYWAQWMHGHYTGLTCWSLGLVAGICALIHSIRYWGFMYGFAVFAILTFMMIGLTRSLAFIFPLQVMLAIVCMIIGCVMLIA